ncbi:chromosome partitioning protein [Dietzia sp. B32]|uniref:chromosome partitioning protein n=1 Tax=Dietzia sp. B32 TaxID=2915130 RepID=UPI0021ADA6A3|nr:chromosome partitioning protein [Dietzia sp. B32]UVE94460.1 chromosome partitioning protein [Dietzia sp. B32]
MNTTTRTRSVAVDVTDPDLDADVRAVLAALALDTDPAGGAHGEVVVTDRADPMAGVGGSRVVRIGSDREPGDDDDEVVRLPSGTGDLVGMLLAPAPTRSGPLVEVAGAVGGCGASTLAAALAVRAAPSIRTLLVEADPHGTGVDLLLGAEDRPGLRVEDVRADLGGPDPEALWGAVPEALPGLGVLARSRRRPAPADPAPVRDGAPGAMQAHREAGGLVVSDRGGLADGGPAPAGADLVVVVTRADLSGAVAAGHAVHEAPGAVLVIRTGRADPLHAADVADAAGARRWFVLPEIAAVRRAAGAGDLGTALHRGRAGRVRRLAAVADVLLEQVGLDGR